MLTTLSEDGRTLYFVIANASWEQSFPCTIQLAHFRVAAVRGTILSQDNRNAPGLVDRKEDVTRALEVDFDVDRLQFVLPGHSIIFLEVRAK